MAEEKKITSIGEYLEQIEEAYFVHNPDINLEFKQTRLFFRGQGKSHSMISPRLMRESNNLSAYEYKLLRDAQNMLWQVLTECRTYLEKLAYFQHYGLPTRLLDVTTNPLVALYFACCEEKYNDEDGVVYIGYIQEENVNVVYKMVEYIFEHEDSFFLNHSLDTEALKQFSHPYYVYPAANSPRISKQSGEFLIAPLINADSDISKLERLKTYDFSSCFEKKIIVPHEHKQSILKKLDLCGVNPASLFLDAEHQLRYIANKYEYYTPKIDE